MTEEEKDRLVRAKADITEELHRINIGRYHLEQVDGRLVTYIRQLIDNPQDHNLYEQLAVRKFFHMARRYGINATEVRRFIVLYESLQFPGKGGDRCYPLTPVQTFQFTSIYGFWKDGRRVVREVCLFVPRKYSKTTSAAAMPLYDLFFGEANAECYVGANSSDQAKKCFDVIRGCVRHLDPRGRRYRVNEQTIKSLRADRSAFAQCLTANARTKDGLNASTVVMDEFSQARDNNLLTTLTTSMGIRDNPLTVIITTASDVFDGPFYDMLNGYKMVLLGDMEDDTLFAHIFEPDIGDAEDDPHTWHKVHPHLGITVNEDFYFHEYRKAQRDGADAMLAFRTKLLNIYAENERASWIGSTKAREVSRKLDIASIRGYPDAMVAIDLSERDDFSAVTVGLYEDSSKHFYFHTAYFFPKGALKTHPNRRLYTTWAEKGYLILTDGDVIDYRVIVEYILWLNKYVHVLSVGYDPWKSHQVLNMLSTAIVEQNGDPDSVLTGVSQSYGSFNAPTEFFEHGVFSGNIFINDNPINFYCFGNAVIDEDNLENRKPVKRKHTEKIDGVITTLMCLKLFLDGERQMNVCE